MDKQVYKMDQCKYKVDMRTTILNKIVIIITLLTDKKYIVSECSGSNNTAVALVILNN